jgi:hypothetical protein
VTEIPQAAVDAAAVAIHDADCADQSCSGSALGHAHRLARLALQAAVPFIVAAEQERMQRYLNHQDAAAGRGLPGATCSPPHAPDYRCVECVTEEEWMAATAPHPLTGAVEANARILSQQAPHPDSQTDPALD